MFQDSSSLMKKKHGPDPHSISWRTSPNRPSNACQNAVTPVQQLLAHTSNSHSFSEI